MDFQHVTPPVLCPGGVMDFLPLTALRQAENVLLLFILHPLERLAVNTGMYVPAGQIIQDQDGQKHNTVVLHL